MDEAAGIWEDSYACEAGTPTLTLIPDPEYPEQKMLPWHSLMEGEYDGDNILLVFQEYNVTLKGEHLDELWQSIQLQDVRWIRVVNEPTQIETTGKKQAPVCRVLSMEITAEAGEGEE